MKYTLYIISLLLLSACSLFNISKNNNDLPPENYLELMANTEEKKILYSCNFSATKSPYPDCTFVQSCEDNRTCFKVTDLDYVSFYIPFNFQTINLYATDYIMNLARSLEKDQKTILRGHIANTFNPVRHYFYQDNKKDEIFKNMQFANMQPNSFATSTNNDISVFISKKDILLRSIIYPSLKLYDLNKPKPDFTHIVQSEIEYTVYPHAFGAAYLNDETSATLGAPSFSQYENDLKSIVEYFFKISLNKDRLEQHNVPYILDSEKARPFVFEEKIRAAKARGSKEILPALPKKGDGFINEYLPSYSLEKVELIRASASAEMVLKSYDKDNIAELIVAEDPLAGFTHRVNDIGTDKLYIRFHHTAKEPRFPNSPRYFTYEIGLASIFNKLRKNIVTTLEVSKPYEFSSIPSSCLQVAEIEKMLTDNGVADYLQDNLKNFFKTNNHICTDYEAFMTKVIFSWDYTDKYND